jgi:hypothetical protein
VALVLPNGQRVRCLTEIANLALEIDEQALAVLGWIPVVLVWRDGNLAILAPRNDAGCALFGAVEYLDFALVQVITAAAGAA